jgi:dTDP-4-amino-4,6-dideoxygalactose transaminase
MGALKACQPGPKRRRRLAPPRQLNYRIDLSAALGLAQVERLDEILAARDEVAARYGELLARLDDVAAPLPDDDAHHRSWFVYVVTLAAGIDRDEVIARLGAEGIASKPYLPSIHLQPYFRERFGYREDARLGVTAPARSRFVHSPLAAGIRARGGRARQSLG